jgi:hypothetical protein
MVDYLENYAKLLESKTKTHTYCTVSVTKMIFDTSSFITVEAATKELNSWIDISVYDDYIVMYTYGQMTQIQGLGALNTAMQAELDLLAGLPLTLKMADPEFFIRVQNILDSVFKKHIGD